MRVGIIIQGPIMSPGIAGCDWAARTINAVPKAQFKTPYNSSQDVIDNYHYFKSKGCPVVISVWHDCDTTEIEKHVDARDIVRSVKQKMYDDFNNEEPKWLVQYLQMYTIASGLKLIEDKCDVVFKLRTDFRVSFERLEELLKSDWLADWYQNYQHSFLVPYFLRNRIITMSDFYFLARVEDYKKMIEGCFEKRQFHDLKSAHYLFPMTFFSEIKIDDDGLLTKVYRSQQMTSGKLIGAYRKLYQTYVSNRRLYPLPQSLFESASWRGSMFIENDKYQHVVKNMLFADQSFAKTMRCELLKFCCDLFFLRGQVYPPFGRCKYYLSFNGIKTMVKVSGRRFMEAIGVKKFK